MNRPGFLQGALLALGLALAGGAVWYGATLFAAGATVAEATVVLLSGIYVVYLLAQSRQSVGRLVTTAAWAAFSAVVWFAEPDLLALVLAHTVFISIIRALYFHANLLGAAADLGLSVLAAGFAAWAGVHSGSVPLAVWCFFLTHAAFVFIPDTGVFGNREEHVPDHCGAAFDRAYRAGRSAARQLSGG